MKVGGEFCEAEPKIEAAVTCTVPCPEGVVAVQEVPLELQKRFVTTVFPNMISVAEERFSPAMLTVVPPACGPKSGDTEVTTDGAGGLVGGGPLPSNTKGPIAVAQKVETEVGVDGAHETDAE